MQLNLIFILKLTKITVSTRQESKFQNQLICKICSHNRLDISHRLVVFQELKHSRSLEGNLDKLGFHTHMPHHTNTNEADCMRKAKNNSNLRNFKAKIN